MSAYITHIETIVPEHIFTQEHIRDLLKKNVGEHNRATQSIIHRVFSKSDIQKRHSVISDFSDNESAPLFFDIEGNHIATPSTKKRNDIYIREAKSLFVKAAQHVLEKSALPKTAITHVITVSCTGFFAPGPEFHVVKELGLPQDVERYHIGFMGCFAAFPALKMATQFCEANPNAVVLVVALELCTLHLQFGSDTDTILSNSVFADGGAAVILQSKPAPAGKNFKIHGFQSGITPEGENDMAWTVGDSGFDMVLTSYVPKIIEANIQSMVASVLEKYGKSVSDIPYWGIHPGGRAIIDGIARALELTEKQCLPSRNTLRAYGNMSSATVLFVLKSILEHHNGHPNELVLAMAFGPGLTVETGLLEITG